MSTIEFKGWPKTPRLFRDITITEKIDGTNSAVVIVPWADLMEEVSNGHNWSLGYFKQWHAESDNLLAVVGDAIEKEYDGSRWIEYGWGAHAVFAQSRNRLITPESDNFGFARWVQDNADALVNILGPGYHYGEWWGAGIQRRYGLGHKRFSLFNVNRYADKVEIDGVTQLVGLNVVPTIYEGPYSEEAVLNAVELLREQGSLAAPGYMNPEGVIVFHSASRQVYKVTLENDEQPKGLVA